MRLKCQHRANHIVSNFWWRPNRLAVGPVWQGGSNYNPNAMYFPFSLTFTLPAGQSGQIQLAGGENGLGCGSIRYAVYQL